jgi:hypothetical protein
MDAPHPLAEHARLMARHGTNAPEVLRFERSLPPDLRRLAHVARLLRKILRRGR